MQIAEIGGSDQHAVAHFAVRRLKIHHRLAIISHGDRATTVCAGAELAGASHRQTLDLNLISSRRQRLRAIAAADREVGGKCDLATEHLRLEMDDHMPWARREVKNPPPRCALALLRGDVLVSSEVTPESDQMHMLACIMIELRDHLTPRAVTANSTTTSLPGFWVGSTARSP